MKDNTVFIAKILVLALAAGVLVRQNLLPPCRKKRPARLCSRQISGGLIS